MNVTRNILLGIIGSTLSVVIVALIPIDQWIRNFPSSLKGIILAITIMFILLYWIFYLLQWRTMKINGFSFKKVSNDKYTMNINLNGRHIINIIYGKINHFDGYDKKTLVILPANDKFDDECIEDTESVLGSFARSLYPNGNESLKNDIKNELIKRNKESFNIGDCISIDVKSSDSEFKIGIVAVTNKRDDNIIASSENVMLAFKGILKIMTKQRIQRVYMPLIGSGHGGLSPELSLLCILISAIEHIKNNTGNILRDVNIVVYKKNSGERDIPVERMKRIVKFVLNHCK